MRIVLSIQQKNQQSKQQQQPQHQPGPPPSSSPPLPPAGPASADPIPDGGGSICPAVAASESEPAVSARSGAAAHDSGPQLALAFADTAARAEATEKEDRADPGGRGRPTREPETGREKPRGGAAPPPALLAAVPSSTTSALAERSLAAAEPASGKEPPFAAVAHEDSAPATVGGEEKKARKRKFAAKAHDGAGATNGAKPNSARSGKAGHPKKSRHHHGRPHTKGVLSCLPAANAKEGKGQISGANQRPDVVSDFSASSSSYSRKAASGTSGSKKDSKMGRGPRDPRRPSWGREHCGRPIFDRDQGSDRENVQGPECDDPIEVRSGDAGFDCYSCNGPEDDENDPASVMGQQRTMAISSSSSSSVRRGCSVDAGEPVSLSDFEVALKKRGLEMVEQEGDGNCLFRAVSLQVYGDPNMHGEVRKRCLDFMAKDEAHFSQFITDEPFLDYVRRKRIDGVHGNNPEIQAVSELFNRPVEVFVPENGANPINIFHAEYKTGDTPIRLSYHDGNHYNAVVDPLIPTAGLGLGLPGLEPGLADRLQMEKAKEESEIEKVAEESHKAEVERVMKESSTSVDRMYKQKAVALSDLEATDFELEQAVLESSLESYRNTEMGRKQPWSNRERRRQGNLSPVAADDRYGMTRLSAAIPTGEEQSSSAASTAVAARASAAASMEGAHDEYPETVQELVMNGFDLQKVLRAYELVGDNFDALLAFLMSNAN